MTTTRALAVLFSGALLFGAAACGDDSAADSTATPVVSDVANSGVVKVSPTDGAALIESMGAELTVVDVRTPGEFAAGHLEGAVNMDVEGGQFSAMIADLPTDAAYIVYCQSGRRSAIAAQAMVDAGFTEVYDLGGIADWQAAGLPVVTG
jgi:rhodanese-related sulfurtransferase